MKTLFNVNHMFSKCHFQQIFYLFRLSSFRLTVALLREVSLLIAFPPKFAGF